MPAWSLGDQCETCGGDEWSARRQPEGSSGSGYILQCMSCGATGRSIDYEYANDLGVSGDVDRTIRGRFLRRGGGSRHLAMKARYRAYLNSPEWREIRGKVLARDRYKCQGCLVERASDVHHLTYDHIGAEFAFELVSLCRTCHERIHHHEGSG